MILSDYNGTSSLCIDNIERIKNRVRFCVSVFLSDDVTVTDIQFQTDSYIEIDEWQRKSERLLAEHKMELDHFSFRAVLDQMYSRDNHKISNLNFFELQGHSSCLSCSIESAELFGQTFEDEISEA